MFKRGKSERERKRGEKIHFSNFFFRRDGRNSREKERQHLTFRRWRFYGIDLELSFHQFHTSPLVVYISFFFSTHRTFSFHLPFYSLDPPARAPSSTHALPARAPASASPRSAAQTPPNTHTVDSLLWAFPSNVVQLIYPLSSWACVAVVHYIDLLLTRNVTSLTQPTKPNQTPVLIVASQVRGRDLASLGKGQKHTSAADENHWKKSNRLTLRMNPADVRDPQGVKKAMLSLSTPNSPTMHCCETHFKPPSKNRFPHHSACPIC